LSSLQAVISMEKYDSQLKVSDITEGTVKYLPKTKDRVMYVRVDWTKPLVEQILVIGNSYTLYRPRLKQVIVGTTDKAKNNGKIGGAFSFMSMSKNELNANYTYRHIDEENVKGAGNTAHLELTPKKAAAYKLAHLWVDGDGMPVMAKIVEKNDDTTTILFSNMKKNLTLKGPDFAIDYPKSIKPIQG
jgi:outer membrane lipoprotein-sorting protein